MAEPKRSFPRWWVAPALMPFPAHERPMVQRARRKAVQRRQADETKWRGRAFCSSTWRGARKVIPSTRREWREGFAVPDGIAKDDIAWAQPDCSSVPPLRFYLPA